MPTAHLCPYLMFNGNAREALEFYHSCMGGKVSIMAFKDAPMPSDPAMQDRVMHGMLENDALSFMASDSMQGEVAHGTTVHLCVSGTDHERLTEMFTKLSAGGKVTRKLEKAFWGDTFGMFTDKFGFEWMFSITEKKA